MYALKTISEGGDGCILLTTCLISEDLKDLRERAAGMNKACEVFTRPSIFKAFVTSDVPTVNRYNELSIVFNTPITESDLPHVQIL